MKRLLSLTLITLGTTFCLSAQARDLSTSQKAEQLNLEAYQLYDRGQYLSAIETWKQALALYKKAKQLDAVGEVTLEISQAQKDSGQGVEACSTLQRYLKAEPSLCIPANGVKDIEPPTIGPTENDAIAAMDFARILRNFGLFEEANLYADASLQAAKENNLTELIPDFAIDRANIELVKVMFDRDRWTYQGKTHLNDVEANELIARFTLLFKQYEQQVDSPIALEARLKWLTTYQELQKHNQLFKNDTFQSYPTTLRSQYISFLQDISGFSEFDQFPPSEQLRVREDIARILNHARKSITNETLDASSLVWIENLMTAADNLGHQHYLASGYALLGDRFQSKGQNSKAIDAYRLASKHSQLSHPRYRWEHTIAKLYESIGNESQAERFYNSAIALVEEAEFNMSPLEQAVRTHFQESVRPVYDDYIKFQLGKNKPDFEKVFDLRNRYTDKTLEVYLDCGTIESLPLDNLYSKDSQAVFISIFKVGTQYYTLLKNGDNYAWHRADAVDIDPILFRLSGIFESEGVKVGIYAVNADYQALYNLILAPIFDHIEAGQTILFAQIDPSLQQIPLSAIYDGEQYLIEKHPIALIGNTIYEPKQLDKKQFDVFFAGISDQPDAKTTVGSVNLPYVLDESKKIQPDKSILNQNFTKTNFVNNLNRDFPIVHIATHGQFSSKPEETFLVAWDGPLNLDDLSRSIQLRTLDSPIELLVLSACETANGDRLATLGIAGFSIRAGARSTLATLWQAIDSSSPFLMERFYQYLG